MHSIFPLIILFLLDAFSFSKASSIQHPTPVYNVIPGDFTHDGKLDLLVMSPNRASTGLDITLYVGNHDGSFSETSPFVPMLPS